MDFKNWMIMTEMGRARIPEGETFSIPSLADPQTGHRDRVGVTPQHIIDMRFEDYGQALGDFSPWQVRLPDGRYLINHGMFNYEVSKAPGKYKEVPQEATSVHDGKTYPWYDFAEVIDGGNQLVKPAIHQHR